MSRRLGAYVPLYESYDDDDAILALSIPAELLFLRILAAAKRANADGYLTERQVAKAAHKFRKIGPLLAEIVGEQLLEPADGGYVVRSWLKWNKSADDLGRLRAQDRERKEAAAKKKAALLAESQRIPDGIPPESERKPSGTEPTSERNPSSRAPARAAAEQDRTELDLTGQDRDPPGAALTRAADSQTLIADWISGYEHRPPTRFVSQVGQQVKSLLEEGMQPQYVAAALSKLRDKGCHPTVLPSLVAEAISSQPSKARDFKSEQTEHALTGFLARGAM